MAPLLPHMAEDIWQNLPYPKKVTSIFQNGWVDPARFPAFEPEAWEMVLKLRNDVNKCMEAGRRDGVIGASLEAAVYIAAPADSPLRPLLERLSGDATLQHPPSKSNNVDDLRFLLLASQVHIVDSAAEVEAACEASLVLKSGTESEAVVGIRRAKGKKCARCWYYCESVDSQPDMPHVCPRCAHVVRVQRGSGQEQLVGRK